ncbi:MAG: hypothetical protein WC894_03670 [Patescibacteria group bacterium]
MTIHNAVAPERIKAVLGKNQFPPTVAVNNLFESDFQDVNSVETPNLNEADLTTLKNILKRSPIRSSGIITRDFPKSKQDENAFKIITEGMPYEYRNYGSGYIQSEFRLGSPQSQKYEWNDNPEGLARKLDSLVVETQTSGYFLTSRHDAGTGHSNYRAVALDRPFAKSVSAVYFLPVQKEMGGLMKKNVKRAYIQAGEKFYHETDKEAQYVLIIKGNFGLPGSRPSTNSTMPKDYIYLELTKPEDVLTITKLLKMADQDEISSRDLLAYLLWDEQKAKTIIESDPATIKLNPILTEKNTGVHFIIPRELKELTN